MYNRWKPEASRPARRLLHPVLLPHDLPRARVPGGAPVLGRHDLVQPIELTDALQAREDELPGTGAVGVDFALRFG